MKNQAKIDQTKPPPETAQEAPVADGQTIDSVPIDPKELARQRSKDDLARKRRDMHQKRGKR